MNRLAFRTIFTACAAAAVLPQVHAAPLDALLTVTKPVVPGSVKIEAGYDLMNGTVDVFNFRDDHDDFAGTNVGDYHGGHVLAGVAVTPNLWIDGGLWKRKIDYRQDEAKIESWQLAAQYKLFDALAYRPAVAVRVGAWGNRADSLSKSTPTRFQGVDVSSVNVDSPKDQQYQLDLIATWPVAKSTEVSAFAGVGSSRVRIGDVNGVVVQGGCSYNVAFGRSVVAGALARPCGGVTEASFSAPTSALGVNIYDEAEYKARFAHVGFSAAWQSGAWQLRGGYQFQVQRRDDVDDLIEARGGSASKNNHVLVGEVVYQLTSNVALFGRGQYMQHQFTGEIPFAYNTLTAHRFKERYGIVTTGVMVSF